MAQQWNQASDLPGGGLPLRDIGGTPNAPRNQCRQDPQSVQQGTLREGIPPSNWGLMGPEELFSTRVIWPLVVVVGVLHLANRNQGCCSNTTMRGQPPTETISLETSTVLRVRAWVIVEAGD